MTGKNGRDIGKDHLATLKAFLRTGKLLPVSPKDGTLNITALVEVTGIPRSSFYQNEHIEKFLEKARKRQNIKRQGESVAILDAANQQPDREPSEIRVKNDDPKVRALERRLHRLELQNAAVVAENLELRRQVKDLRLQLGRQDMMIDTGRRVVGPPAGS